MDKKAQFSKMTVILHWVIALAMIGMLAFGLYLEDMPRSPEKGELMGLHKSIGILVLLLASYRVIHRLINKMPRPIKPMPEWQEKTATGTHLFLLLGTLFMPLSGVMMSVGGGRAVNVFGLELLAAGDKIEWLRELGGIVHGFGSTLLIIVILLHVAGALKHQLIDRDGTMKRMLGSRVDD